MSNRLFSPLANISKSDRSTGFKDNCCDDIFAGRAGRNTDNRYVANSWHRANSVLNLAGVHVKTRGVNHFLTTIGHVDESVAYLDKVTRTKPALFGEDLSCFLRLLPVSGEHLGTSCNEFANFTVFDILRRIILVDNADVCGWIGNAKSARATVLCQRGT
ncbi:Uncharacterised protein [Chlamydia trachomatis]|nr:Uncharacterised protein [Chlamydia trachomatis]